MKQNLLELKDVSKLFDTTEALKDIDLNVKKNEFITLLGPSGCGKTTILRIIGGFEYPTNGRVYFEDIDITDMPPYKRRVNTVFQRYSLFPHMDVYDNIAFGLNIKKVNKNTIKTKVEKMLDLVNLSGFENRTIDSLSGGQQQRIAIARALVNEPEVLLLDEPLAALDLKLRKEMQVELKNMQQSLGITFVYVTHDQEEALTMSDTVVVMNHGVIQQMGSPEDIYNEPNNVFVADFIGASNIIDGIMIQDLLVEFSGREFICVDKGFGENRPVDIVIRPEDIKIVDKDAGMLEGIVKSVTFKGVHYEILVESQGYTWMVHTTLIEEVGKRVGLSIFPDDIHIMEKEEGL